MPVPLKYSVVVPVFNEQESLPVLHAEIASVLDSLAQSWELILVDDRSTDGSLRVMLELRRSDPHLRIICLRRNSGQTPALSAGFDHARGEIVITLDGDLQNDPADFPALLTELERGYDIVVGWRKKRHDGFLLRRLPSIAANRLIAWVTGVRIHDTGCTLKAMRRELVRNLPIYAEQHRFLPAISRGSGARVSEIVVNHRPRRFGASKYGIGRAFRVLSDLLIVKMIASFTQRPAQYFGLLALPFMLGTLAFLVVGMANYHDLSLANRWGRVAVLLFMLFSMLCVYFLLLGLLAELAVKASGLHRRRVLGRVMTTSVDG